MAGNSAKMCLDLFLVFLIKRKQTTVPEENGRTKRKDKLKLTETI